MKPLYWVLIAVGVIIIGIIVVKSRSKSTVVQSDLSNQQQIGLTPGGTSSAAQIINALFPFVKIGLDQFSSSGCKDGIKKPLTCGKTGQPRCTEADLRAACYTETEIKNILSLQFPLF